MTLGKAAEILRHYIEVALSNADTTITPDMSAELNDAVEAFRDADRALDAVVTRR